jgi:hypothetical protein
VPSPIPDMVLFAPQTMFDANDADFILFCNPAQIKESEDAHDIMFSVHHHMIHNQSKTGISSSLEPTV